MVVNIILMIIALAIVLWIGFGIGYCFHVNELATAVSDLQTELFATTEQYKKSSDRRDNLLMYRVHKIHRAMEILDEIESDTMNLEELLGNFYCDEKENSEE